MNDISNADSWVWMPSDSWRR